MFVVLLYRFRNLYSYFWSSMALTMRPLDTQPVSDGTCHGLNKYFEVMLGFGQLSVKNVMPK